MSVSIYTTPSCPYCTMAKQYMSSKNLSYTEYDVSRDTRKAEEMVRKSGQMGVPVIEINGRVILGFNRPEIDRALAG
ncbi:MAG: glutathione S-transferase N-terminal domain-containing protein [Spirochaetales bacterium]|nr:glutathione S-transferase N-terminal domain-containing protein [Spirochaetales bacterium]